MPLNTSNNPYYDDFDETKNFHRILFKPGQAVQARELTQTQSILQNQIDKFGQHMFKEGTIVLGGGFNIDLNLKYVKVKDTDISGNTINNILDYIGTTAIGINGVSAYINDAVEGYELSGNTKTLIISYLSGSNDGEVSVFSGNDNLTCNTRTAVVIETNPIGNASRFTINEGTIFVNNYFVNFEKQSIILDKYSNSPNCKIGFTVVEEIVTASQDSTLLDPALGSYNYSAPGADRLKVSLELVTIDINDPGDENFIELVIIRNGIIEKSNDVTLYNIIGDNIARRTFDESGDYYVRGFDINIREHLDTGTNLGYLSSINGGNTSYLAVGVEGGVAYVKGYEIKKLVTSYIPIEKGLEYESFDNQVITARFGNYVECDEVSGSFDLNEPINVYLYDTAQNIISDKEWSASSPAGNIIGTGRLKGIEHSDGLGSVANSRYNIYLSDISLTDSFSNVRSIFSNTSTSNSYADIVLVNGSAKLEDSGISTLLYSVGSSHIKTIRDSGGNPDTTFISRKTVDNITIATTGIFTIELTGDETVPYSDGALSDSEKRQCFVTLGSNKEITLPGTVWTYSGNNVINGSGTAFTRLNAGDKLKVSGLGTNTYFISSITSDTKLEVIGNVGVNTIANTAYKVYKVGDIIDFTSKGVAAGTERSIESSVNSTTLTFDLKETFGDTIPAVATISVVNDTQEAKKTLKPSRYVQINCASAGVTGPFNLGFSDIYKVNSIRVNTAIFTANTEGTEQISNFIIDNGQRDEVYELGTITPKITLTNTSIILVNLDYFEPNFSQGYGYFSVDSYPIDDTLVASDKINTAQIPVYKSPITGTNYNLRNYLDFRPVKNITAADSTTVAGATINPGVSTTFSDSTRLLQPTSSLTYDYSSYLGRKDLIVINKNGVIYSIKGIPAINTITPAVPQNVMPLGVINITPYPSLSPSYAASLNRKDLATSGKKTSHIRHTMRDIGVLKQRIQNLEYYNVLNSLEKNASDMLIIDENGLDRFKNGIFVDTFSNDSLGATYNSDYCITVDPKEKVIRPRFEVESVGYNYLSGSDVIVSSNTYITLPYTEEVLLENSNATTTRNIENSSYRFVGRLTLLKETDVWTDTQQTERDIDLSNQSELAKIGTVTTVWNNWQTVVTGARYDVIDDKTNQLLFTSSDLAEAQSVAADIAASRNVRVGDGGVRIEGVSASSESTRTGTKTSYIEGETTTYDDNKVINTEIIPYIRPQIIYVSATNVKPNTKFHIFFDGEKMDEYITPGVFTGNSTTLTGSEGDAIYSDTTGKVTGFLRLPVEGKRFRFGTKEVILTDSITNEPDATSYAQANFVAQGLVQTKLNTVYSTTQVIAIPTSLFDESSVDGTSYSRYYPPECTAYSFYIDVDPDQEGIFLTSFDVFMSAKSSIHGVWFEIREIDESGGITQTQIPHSEVWFESDELVVSDDATTPINVKFDCPIFLFNKTQYAMVMHGIATNPDSYFWVSKIGQNDINSGQQVTSRAFTGNLYTTNNNMTWDLVPLTDLKVKFYRAKFNTDTAGIANFGNKPVEFLNMSSIDSRFDYYGEQIKSGDRLTLSSISGGTIANTNIIVGGTSGKKGSVIDIVGAVYTTTNTGFVSGESISVTDSGGGSLSITGTISSIANSTGTLTKCRRTLYDDIIIDLVDSTGSFIANDKIFGSITGNHGLVGNIDQRKYTVMDFEPSYIAFRNAGVQFRAKTTANGTNTLDSVPSYINVEDNTTFKTERTLLSRSKELSVLSGAPSNQIVATLTSDTEFLSPVIDLTRFHSIYVENIINNDITGEHDVAFGGNAINKYISKIITLAEGQDAEDLLVYLTAYKPSTTSVNVYIKIKHFEDVELFDSKKWILLECPGELTYSSIANENDFIEYEYKIPASFRDTLNEQSIVAYTSNNGIYFKGFKQFQIKIVLTASNSALVPRVGDLRTIALQL